MRLILGIILGVIITLGGAYLRDQTIPNSPSFPHFEPLTAQRVVNWEVLGAIAKEQTDRARAEIEKFLARRS
jgi:hypothetical protein